jgi:hypothetical protein
MPSSNTCSDARHASSTDKENDLLQHAVKQQQQVGWSCLNAQTLAHTIRSELDEDMASLLELDRLVCEQDSAAAGSSSSSSSSVVKAPEWLETELRDMPTEVAEAMMLYVKSHQANERFVGSEEVISEQMWRFFKSKNPTASDQVLANYHLVISAVSKKQPAAFFSLLEQASRDLNEQDVLYLLNYVANLRMDRQLSNDGY